MSSPARSDAALARRLQGLNLYLVGMMGAGKSAVGRPLAAALGYRFIDADQVLEQSAGRPIPAIFESDGEAGFRELETAVLDRISSWHSLVVATGGGVVIWLDAPADLLLERLQADATPRPLLATPEPATRLEQLLQARRPLYAQADLRVEQHRGDDPQAVAQRVVEALPTILKERAQPPEAPVQLEDGDGRPTQSIN